MGTRAAAGAAMTDGATRGWQTHGTVRGPGRRLPGAAGAPAYILTLTAAYLLTALGFLHLAAPALALARAELPADSVALVAGTGAAGLRLHSAPGLAYAVVAVPPEGARLRVLAGPQAADGLAWYLVEWASAPAGPARGWADGAYLAPEPEAPADEFDARVFGYTTAAGGPSRTATGTLPRPGTAAVDPAVIPFGSLLAVEEYEGLLIAEDAGAAVRGRTVEIWFPDAEAARAWGVRTTRVRILRRGY